MTLALLSFTHEFFERDRGSRPIKFRELVDRSGIKNHGNLQRIINRLVARNVVRVTGTGRQTRTYSFVPIAEQALFVNSAEQEISELRNDKSLNGEQSRSSIGKAHKKKEEVSKNPEEGADEGLEDQPVIRLPYEDMVNIAYLKAEQKRCSDEGLDFPAILQDRLAAYLRGELAS